MFGSSFVLKVREILSGLISTIFFLGGEGVWVGCRFSGRTEYFHSEPERKVGQKAAATEYGSKCSA